MQDLGPAERERLMRRFGRRFQRGELIFREGDPADAIHVLQEGSVRIAKRLHKTERTVLIVRPNELFGVSAALEHAVRSSTATALTDSSSLALDQATFRRVVETNGLLAVRFVQQLVRRLRDTEDQIEIMMLGDVQARIVTALVKLAQASGAQPSSSCSLQLSPVDLAARVGLDVDTVKRGIARLRDGQYVRVVDERLEIPDVDALQRLHSVVVLQEEIRGGPDAILGAGRPRTV